MLPMDLAYSSRPEPGKFPILVDFALVFSVNASFLVSRWADFFRNESTWRRTMPVAVFPVDYLLATLLAGPLRSLADSHARIIQHSA